MTWVVPGSPAEVLRRLRDPDVAARRAASDVTLPAEVTELAGGGESEPALMMTIEASLPDSWIPPQVRGRLTNTPRVVRREVWTLTPGGTAVADVTITLESVPATTLLVDGRLTPRCDGTLSDLVHDLALTVGIPVLGSVLEQAVLAKVVQGYQNEADVILSA